MKGKAEAFKDHVKIIPNGSILTVRFDDGLVNSATAAAAAVKKAPASDKIVITKAAPKAAPKVAPDLDSEQRSLLERVLKSDNKPAEKLIVEKSVASKPAEKAQTQAARPLGGGAKPMMSPLRVMGKLGLIIGVLLACLIGFKKLLKGNSALSKLAKSSIGKKKMIEVLSTHHLGPKKSIAVVKIAGRMLVLGIANESINLIAQLNQPADSVSGLDLSELEDLGLMGVSGNTTPAIAMPKANPVNTPSFKQVAAPAQNSDSDIFAKFLDSEASKPATYSAAVNHSALKSTASRATAAPNSVRAQIRNRLEGLKQL